LILGTTQAQTAGKQFAWNFVKFKNQWTTGYTWGLLYLPKSFYSDTTKKYPTIVFSHGLGHQANPTTQLTAETLLPKNGLPQLIKDGTVTPVYIDPGDGKEYEFIVVSLEGDFGAPLAAFSEFAVNNDSLISKRIDRNALYLTGLSAGGGEVFNWVLTSKAFAKEVAAIVPMSSVYWATALENNFAYPNDDSVKVWAFHGPNDATTSYAASKTFTDKVKGSRLTPLPVSHSNWNSIYNGLYKENFVVNGVTKSLNIYEWMLWNRKNRPVAVNKVPTVRSFKTQYTFPSTSISTTIDATDSDGVIKTYQWIKPKTGVTGVKDSTAKTTEISAMVPGEYSFNIVVTDDKGAKGYGVITLIVLEEPTVQLGEFNFNGCVFKFYGKKSSPKTGTYIIQ